MDKPYLIIERKIEGVWQFVQKVELKTITDNRGNWLWKSYRIGRSPDCEISISCVGNLISRFQALLERDDFDDDYFISDGIPGKVRSANGTRVNGVKIEAKVKLKHHDNISLGMGIRVIYYNEKMPILQSTSHDETYTGDTTNVPTDELNKTV